MTHALRVLLQGIVDYAGLFPPAGLDIHTAAANYAEYRSSPDAWALGRFVVPLGRVDELLRLRQSLGRSSTRNDEWRLSALVGGDITSELQRVRAFNAMAGDLATIDALEVKAETTATVAGIARAVSGDIETFIEVPVGEDPAPLVGAIATAGLKAKIRTGGTSAEAFPSSEDVIRFMRRCFEEGVAFKATAGLHHPLRGSYRLTYDDGAPCATMFGFLNVFLAAAALREGAADDEVRSVLECDVSFATFDSDGVTVLGRLIPSGALQLTRERLANAFGSCSFTEPMNELRALGLL